MKRICFVINMIVISFTLFAVTVNPSLDGRALVADRGELPQGNYGKAPGYLPGDTVIVTNHTTGFQLEVMIISGSDSSEGVAIILAPEAAEKLMINKGNDVYVKIQKKQATPYENAVTTQESLDKLPSVSLDPDNNPQLALQQTPQVEEIVQEEKINSKANSYLASVNQIPEESVKEDENNKYIPTEQMVYEEPEVTEVDTFDEQDVLVEVVEEPLVEEEPLIVEESLIEEEPLVEEVPELAEETVEEAPELAEETVEEVPELAEGIEEEAPELAEEIVEEAPELAEETVEEVPELAEETVEEVPELAEEIVEEVPELVELVEEPIEETEEIVEEPIVESEELVELEDENSEFGDEIALIPEEEPVIEEIAEVEEEAIEEPPVEEVAELEDENTELGEEIALIPEEEPVIEELAEVEEEAIEETPVEEVAELEDENSEFGDEIAALPEEEPVVEEIAEVEEEAIEETPVEEIAELEDENTELGDEIAALPEEEPIIEEIAEAEEDAIDNEDESSLDIVLIPTEMNPAESTESDVTNIEIVEEISSSSEEIVSNVKNEESVTITEIVKNETINKTDIVTPISISKFVRKEEELTTDKYYVQIAILNDINNLDKLVGNYGSKYPLNLLQKDNGSYQVLVGPLTNDEYEVVLMRFKQKEFKDAFVKKIK